MTQTITQTIRLSAGAKFIRDGMGIKSLFGKKPIEEEVLALREAQKLLEEPYLKIITPLPISKEEEKMIKERVRMAVNKLSEIL